MREPCLKNLPKMASHPPDRASWDREEPGSVAYIPPTGILHTAFLREAGWVFKATQPIIFLMTLITRTFFLIVS